MDKLKQAEELRRVNTVWNKIIQRIKINLGIDSNEEDMIDFIVKDEWEKENERSSSNN